MLKIFTENYEPGVIEQLDRLLSVPVFKDCEIRMMPDVHVGAGCCIGFTADLGDYVIPNVVGVDIGCSVSVSKIKEKDLDLPKLDNIIRKHIPFGRGIHDANHIDQQCHEDYMKGKELIKSCYCYRELKDVKRLYLSIGSLGAGNHFIEVDKGEKGDIYLVVHSGSRNFGKQVAEFYQKEAIRQHQGYGELREAQEKLIKEYKETGRKSELQEAIKNLRAGWKAKNPDVPDDLAYLSGEWRDRYLHDMKICQEWARLNHKVMQEVILKEMGWTRVDFFITTHNYIGDDNIIRKGAVSAREGEKLIIPLNMRDGSLICIGLGNKDWNYSVCHGGGRIMSRAQAFRELKLEDYKKSMEGIYTTTVTAETIDEAPMVYKPAEEIKEKIKDSVNILESIKPIYNFKASE